METVKIFNRLVLTNHSFHHSKVLFVKIHHLFFLPINFTGGRVKFWNLLSSASDILSCSKRLSNFSELKRQKTATLAIFASRFFFHPKKVSLLIIKKALAFVFHTSIEGKCLLSIRFYNKVLINRVALDHNPIR